MEFNPYEELNQFYNTRREYLVITSTELTDFRNLLSLHNTIPRTTPLEAIISNNLCCSSTLDQLGGMVSALCAMPLTPDTNMATYDLYNRLDNWTRLYKLHVADIVKLEKSFITGVMQ